MTAAPVTVVVPLRQDTQALAALLRRMRDWSLPPAQVMVTTDHASDALRELAAAHRVTVMTQEGTRGSRLHAAAGAATFGILWFVHADAEPDARSVEQITAAVAAGCEGGCFRFRFQGQRTWSRRLLEVMIGLRFRAGGTAYGDQGLFVTREAYERSGGFEDQALFEEVRLVRELRKRGRFRVLDAPIGVCTRRWDRDGWLLRTLHNRWLAVRYMLGVPVDRLARDYRRQPGEPGSNSP